MVAAVKPGLPEPKGGVYSGSCRFGWPWCGSSLISDGPARVKTVSSALRSNLGLCVCGWLQGWLLHGWREGDSWNIVSQCGAVLTTKLVVRQAGMWVKADEAVRAAAEVG